MLLDSLLSIISLLFDDLKPIPYSFELALLPLMTLLLDSLNSIPVCMLLDALLSIISLISLLFDELNSIPEY